MRDLFPFIVADIGGTHARLGLVLESPDESLTVTRQHIYSSPDFDSVEAIFSDYMNDLTGPRPVGACIAIAGPVLGDQVKSTNVSLSFSQSQLQEQLAFSSLEVINDFAALAYATLQISEEDLVVLQRGEQGMSDCRIVIGPGTGLGVAGLLKAEDKWFPLATEGGHTSFVPTNELELQLQQHIAPDGSHVPVERFVSGPGLTNLYTGLCQVREVEAEHLASEDISARGLSGADPLCLEALQLFCRLMGRTAGNACLTLGAFGGVYLGGGILPHLKNQELMDLLVQSFKDKGWMQSIMARVPIYLITGTFAALDGAACWHVNSQNR